MRIQLTALEQRVIGSLVEKEITTPEHYPLSLNGLATACNQKSSRDPVLNLSESQVQDLVDGLIKKHLVGEKSGFGSRVPKFIHRFCNTGFGSFEFSSQELGVLCLLLLRGPQTAGELRTRSQRLCHFDDVNQVEQVLRGLMARSDGPFVAQLAREPGKRETRYLHLFGDEDDAALSDSYEEPEPRQDDLLPLVQAMRAELDDLKKRVERLESE
jgi:uncharacterized protein YceH (UPF0502 family)